MRVPLNLATSPFIPVRRFLLTVGVLGAVALAATLLVGVEAVQLWRGRTATQARMRELEAERLDHRADGGLGLRSDHVEPDREEMVHAIPAARTRMCRPTRASRA